MCSISLSVDKMIPGYLMHACKCSFIREIEQTEVQGNLSELDEVFNRVVTLRLECKSSREILPRVVPCTLEILWACTLSQKKKEKKDRSRNIYSSSVTV